MAESFKAEVVVKVGWKWKSDGGNPVDNDSVSREKQLSNGHETYQAEAEWHDKDATLLSGNTRTLDLTALTRTWFQDTHTTTFVRVKALVISVAESSSGEMLVGGAASNEWHEPFGAAGDKLRVPLGSPMCLSCLHCGWIVDNSRKNLKLAASGGDLTYSIAIVGTVNACTGTCSTSSF